MSELPEGSEPEIPEDGLEKMVTPSGMSDPVTWRLMHEIREGQLCLLEIPTAEGLKLGTGCLIGPDVILTNWHVARGLDPGKGEAWAIFDHKRDADGSIRSQSVALAGDPLLASSPIEELDFAVLRLAEPVGRRRGWTVLPGEGRVLREGEPLTILQHPDGEPLKVDTDAYRGEGPEGTRYFYTTNTLPGSSGAPCFDKGWEMVALHQGAEDEHNRGIPTHRIRNNLEERGAWAGVGAEEAQPGLHELGEAATSEGGHGGQVATGNEGVVLQAGGAINVEGPIVAKNPLPGRLILAAFVLILLAGLGFGIVLFRGNREVLEVRALMNEVVVVFSQNLVFARGGVDTEALYRNSLKTVAERHGFALGDLDERFEAYIEWVQDNEDAIDDHSRAQVAFHEERFDRAAQLGERAVEVRREIMQSEDEKAAAAKEELFQSLTLTGKLPPS